MVLRTVAYGESDRVVVLLCARRGKVSALAKGARRSQRRFAGGLGLLQLGRATLAERPGAELARLDRFEPTETWPGLYTDLGKIAHAGYAAELLDALAPPRQPDPPIFALACAFARALEAGEARVELLRVFELTLLDRAGLRPVLDRCVACGRPADDGAGQRVDPHRGGIVCGRCGGEGPLLDGAARTALRAAQATDLADAHALHLAPAARPGARAALQAILGAHLGRTLRSVDFIDKLNQAAT